MENIDLNEHKKFLNKTFPEGEIRGYSILKNLLKSEWANIGYEMGDAIVVKLIKFYTHNGLIFKDGNTRPGKYLIV